MKGGIKRAKADLHRYLFEGMSASAREDNQGEESNILSPRGRKRTSSEDPETKVSKREKKSPPEGPTSEGILAAQCLRGDLPSTEP